MNRVTVDGQQKLNKEIIGEIIDGLPIKGRDILSQILQGCFGIKVGNIFADLRRGLTEEQIISKYENKTNRRYGNNAL